MPKKNVEKKATKTTVSKKESTKKVEAKITKKETTLKDNKNNKVKKVPTANVETKETVTTVVKKEENKGKGIVNSVLSNTPFAISLCAIVLLVAALILVLCTKRVPKVNGNTKLVANVGDEEITLSMNELAEILSEKYEEENVTVKLFQDGEYIIANLNGNDITVNELYTAMKNYYGLDLLLELVDGYIATKEVKVTDEVKKYVEDFVAYYADYAEYYGVDLATFLTSYVGINGVTTEEEFYDYVLADYIKYLAVVNYIGEEAKEEDLKKYYEENYFDAITARHILIEVDKDDEDSEKEAYDKAVSLIKKLKKAKDSELEDLFSSLAKENSDDTGTYSNGGLMEDFTRNKVVNEFYDAAAELEDGKFTLEPVKTTYGYHIILKISSTPKDKYDDIKDKVKNEYAQALISEDSTLQITKWDELRKQYKLSINDDELKKLYQEYVKVSSDTDEE